MKIRPYLWAIIVGALATFSMPSSIAHAGTDDPQPCDAAAQALMVRTTAAAIHNGPQLNALTTTTVPYGEVLVVQAQQADEDVGCWYQVQTLTQSLPSPAWIAGSTVAVSVRTSTLSSARPSASARPSVSGVPAYSPAPTYTPPTYVPPVATPSVPYVPANPVTPYVPANPSAGYGVLAVPTPSPTPSTGEADAVLVPRTVRGQVCLDANANTFCDVNEGVAGVPVYVIGAAGQVFAQTRTDGNGVISVVVRAPQRAQLTINVPYLSAYERVSATGDTAPVLVPVGAAIPGLLP